MSRHPISDPAAQTIATRVLETSGEAFLTGNFDMFAQSVMFPHVIVTPEGTRRVETRDALRDTFDNFTAYLRKAQVIDMRRTVETAFFEAADRLHFSYASQLRFADMTTDAPYFCRATMVKQSGIWRLQEAHYALGFRKELALSLLNTDTADTASDPAAHKILQDVLDGLTDAFMQDDFPRFGEYLQFPFFLQGDAGSRIFTDCDSALSDFQAYRTEFVVHEVTEFIRTVKWARPAGDRRIHGMFRSHILRDAKMVIAPYTSAINLEKCDDGRWRCTSVLHPIGHLRDTIHPTTQEDPT